MRASRELFTREVFVSHDALPYEWEAARTLGFKERDFNDGVARWMDNAGPGASSSALRRHRLSTSFPTLWKVTGSAMTSLRTRFLNAWPPHSNSRVHRSYRAQK